MTKPITYYETRLHCAHFEPYLVVFRYFFGYVTWAQTFCMLIILTKIVKSELKKWIWKIVPAWSSQTEYDTLYPDDRSSEWNTPTPPHTPSFSSYEPIFTKNREKTRFSPFYQSWPLFSKWYVPEMLCSQFLSITPIPNCVSTSRITDMQFVPIRNSSYVVEKQ